MKNGAALRWGCGCHWERGRPARGLPTESNFNMKNGHEELCYIVLDDYSDTDGA